MAQTGYGKALCDGSAAIVEQDKVICAIPEERLSRIKYDTGWRRAVSYCLETAGLQLKDVDHIAVSNCCDRVPTLQDLKEIAGDLPPHKLKIVPSHHLSHAYVAGLLSPFEEAMILVADNEGNSLGTNRLSPDTYWLASLERVSVFRMRGTDIQLVARYFTAPNMLGPGTVYNFFTFWLGFPDYHHAGKTMALAAYGRRHRFGDAQLFHSDPDGGYSCRLRNLHRHKGEAVSSFFTECGCEVPPQRSPREPIGRVHEDVAAFVQAEVERILVEIIRRHSTSGGTNWCIGGGVALNCVANAHLAALPCVKGLHADPMGFDIGQSIGNALWAETAFRKCRTRSPITSTYYGREYPLSVIEWAAKRAECDASLVVCPYIPESVARSLARGLVVGVFWGRSEMGPRALGNRSILAAPFTVDLKRYVSERIKGRESFRPLAPVVAAEYASLYFDSPHPSALMTTTGKVRSQWRRALAGVTHVDSSARIQSLDRNVNPDLHSLLIHFMKNTGIPVLINTSFNLQDQPIVETPDEAVRVFLDSALDALVLGHIVLFKAFTPRQKSTLDSLHSRSPTNPLGGMFHDSDM